MKNKKTLLIVIAIFAVILCVGAWSLRNTKANNGQADYDYGLDAGNGSTDDNTPIHVTEFAKQLFTLKNPYIGNASSNGKLLSELREYYQVENSYTVELQTTEAPFWITIQYKDKPETEKMLKMAALFIALTDNCDEFRWSYPNKDGIPQTISITQEFICEKLKVNNLKSYGQSGEKIQELINILEQEPSLQNVDEQSLFVNRNTYSAMDFKM